MKILFTLLALVAGPCFSEPLSPEEALNVKFATELYSQTIALRPPAYSNDEVSDFLAAGALLSGKSPAELVELYRQIYAIHPSIEFDRAASQLAAAAAISGKSPGALMVLFDVFFAEKTITFDAAATLTAATVLSKKSVSEVRVLFHAIEKINTSVVGSAWLTFGVALSDKSVDDLFRLHRRLRNEGAIVPTILAAGAASSGKKPETMIALRAAVSGSAPLAFAVAIYQGINPILELYRRSLTHPAQPRLPGQLENAEQSFKFNWHGAN